MKFVIVSPRQRYGGSIVLHKLCKILEELGYDSRVYICDNFYTKENSKNLAKFWLKHFFTNLKRVIKNIIALILPNTGFIDSDAYKGISYKPVHGCKHKILPIVGDDTIVVYPETFYGNFLGAKNVVRWILLNTNIYDDPSSYDKNDLFFAYREVFNDEKRNPENRICKISNFDWDLYKQTNFGEREGYCYIIRKGVGRADLPETFDGPILDDLSEKKIVEAFNKYKRVYSYDTQTMYSSIAAICGCESVIVPEPGKTISDYRSINERKSYGVAWSDDPSELERARTTVKDLIRSFEEIDKRNLKYAQYFVDECIKYFEMT